MQATDQLTTENHYRIALTLLHRIGPVNSRKIFSFYGSAQAFFKELELNNFKIKGLNYLNFSNDEIKEALKTAEREMLFLHKSGVEMLFFNEKSYPHRLRNCDDSPIILYTKGKLELNSQRFIAVVGTRNSTPYGINMTEKIIEHLSQYNCTLVSGLAYGIDAAAHIAANKKEMQNIGVVAHGLDILYPSLHKPIAEKMKENGGLVSDYVSGTRPNRENFPSRNRLIAGMCDAVIVIEAAAKGGALITAEIASSYNRDVFAVPGNIGEKYSEGCNLLIKNNKAALISKPEDIAWYMRWNESKRKKEAEQLMLFSDLTEDESSVLEIVRDAKTIELDNLAFKSGLAVNKTVTLLLELEFKGLIRTLPGKRYQLKS